MTKYEQNLLLIVNGSEKYVLFLSDTNGEDI